MKSIPRVTNITRKVFLINNRPNNKKCINIVKSPCDPKLISVQFSRSVVSSSLQPHPWTAACQASIHHQLLELTQTHVHWVGGVIQPSHPVIPFSSRFQSFPASGSFQMSQFFESGGQSIGVSASASVLPMNKQGWFPLRLTGLILQSKGHSRVSSSTTIQKHQFFSTQPSLRSNSHSAWLVEIP